MLDQARLDVARAARRFDAATRDVLVQGREWQQGARRVRSLLMLGGAAFTGIALLRSRGLRRLDWPRLARFALRRVARAIVPPRD